MSANSTKGLMIYMSKAKTTPVALVPTAISKAAPPVVTVASAAAIKEGEIVTFGTIGFKELDGKTFVIGKVDATANTFEVKGADTTGSAGALGATPTLSVLTGADQVRMCVASFDPSIETPGTIAVGTFCDPSATLPSAATGAGTLTMTGYVDISEDGYKELLAAELDGKQRWIQVMLPKDQGYIIAPVTISSIGWTLPLEGAIGFTASGALGSKPRHVF